MFKKFLPLPLCLLAYILAHFFFFQTENKAGQSFFNAKKAWHTACDKAQGMEVPFEANN